MIGHPAQPVIWQGAPPHGRQTVGRGTQTFGAVGCVVTSVAMALRFLGIRAGAMPLDVQALGLARPGVWAPGQSGCVIPELCRACDLDVIDDMDGPGKAAPVERLRGFVVETLQAGGVVLVGVDYDRDAPAGDPTAEHWGCAFAIDGDDLLLADPATARTERLLLQTLAGPVRWGRRVRPYQVARAIGVRV